MAIVTLALLANEVSGVWARKYRGFGHVLQDLLSGHPLNMPTRDKRFVLMFRGDGEDRFTLENAAEDSLGSLQTRGTEDVCVCMVWLLVWLAPPVMWI